MKNLALFGTMLTALLLGACGSEKEDKEEQLPAAAVESQEKGDADEVDNKEEKEDKATDTEDGTILNPFIAEDLNADVEVVFTNKNPELKHEFSKDVFIQIDEYQIVHVSNMNESSKTNFDGEDEGYVLTYKTTLVNNSDEDVYYAGGVSLLSDNGMDYIIQRKHLVDREQWLKDDSTDNPSHYSKGNTFTGMNAHSMTKEQFNRLSSPTLKIDALFLNDDVSQRLGEEAIFKIPFNEEGIEKAAVSSQLYQDQMTTDNIAEKELFFEKTDINETKEIDGVKITLNGVQYANITPTEAYKDSFSNFGDSGVVALTAKITIENGSDTPFDKFFVDRKLTVDKNRGTIFNEGMLEPTYRGDFNPGDKEEFITVFLFRKDEFGIFKELELQVGPLKDSDAKPLFKEKSVTFALPLEK
ncbi:DUF5068 domain-containing protein [Solibacillus silvestris]